MKTMSDTLMIAVIAAVPGTAATLFSILNRNKLTQIHILFNSRVDQLVESKVADALRQGHAEGIAQERQRENKGGR